MVTLQESFVALMVQRWQLLESLWEVVVVDQVEEMELDCSKLDYH